MNTTKKYFLTLTALAATVWLGGCGFEYEDANSTAETKTGYYIDSAVEGVDYRCSSTSGTTDEKGAFEYVPGDRCRFFIGKITLHRIDTSTLNPDLALVVEKDPKVSLFLLSLDIDGDPNNGIKITPEVKEIVAGMIGEMKLKKVPQGEYLAFILSWVSQKEKRYGGHLYTLDETMAHLAQTQKEIAKWKEPFIDDNSTDENTTRSHDENLSRYAAILAGKTFFIAPEYEGGKEYLPKVQSVVFDKNATRMTIGGKTVPIAIEGDTLYLRDGTRYRILLPQWADDRFIFLDSLESSRSISLYFERDDAKKRLDDYIAKYYPADFFFKNLGETIAYEDTEGHSGTIEILHENLHTYPLSISVKIDGNDTNLSFIDRPPLYAMAPESNTSIASVLELIRPYPLEDRVQLQIFDKNPGDNPSPKRIFEATIQ